MRRRMRRLVENTGVTYLDYSYRDDFTQNPAYFHNSDHLNKAGGIALSKALRRNLEWP